MTTETLIIGAGLSGLYAGYLLHQEGREFRILESRETHGGRVRSETHAGIPIELGPSWFWPDTNPQMAALVEELKLPAFAHYNEGDILIDAAMGLQRQSHKALDPRRSMRLTKGSRSLTDGLRDALPEDALMSGHRVLSISRNEDQITVVAESAEGEQEFSAHSVIVAMPLRLVEKSLTFSPGLPAAVSSHFRETPTWMAGEAKFFALYETPFWREHQLSGTAFDRAGPLAEVHDASHPDGRGGLFGFFNLDAQQREALGDRLEEECVAQLVKFFGSQAAAPIATRFQDWSRESFTATELDGEQGSQRFLAPPFAANSLWDERLKFAGTEAAIKHGGYLEGALEAAESAVATLAKKA